MKNRYAIENSPRIGGCSLYKRKPYNKIPAAPAPAITTIGFGFLIRRTAKQTENSPIETQLICEKPMLPSAPKNARI